MLAANLKRSFGRRCRRGSALMGAIIIMMTCIIGIGSAYAAKEPSFFYTGNMYLKLKAQDRAVYVAGLLDGIQVSKAFAAPYPKIKKWDDAIQGMGPKKATAVINKYLQDNPQAGERPMNLIILYALWLKKPL